MIDNKIRNIKDKEFALTKARLEEKINSIVKSNNRVDEAVIKKINNEYNTAVNSSNFIKNDSESLTKLENWKNNLIKQKKEFYNFEVHSHIKGTSLSQFGKFVNTTPLPKGGTAAKEITTLNSIVTPKINNLVSANISSMQPAIINGESTKTFIKGNPKKANPLWNKKKIYNKMMFANKKQMAKTTFKGATALITSPLKLLKQISLVLASVSAPMFVFLLPVIIIVTLIASIISGGIFNTLFHYDEIRKEAPEAKNAIEYIAQLDANIENELRGMDISSFDSAKFYLNDSSISQSDIFFHNPPEEIIRFIDVKENNSNWYYKEKRGEIDDIHNKLISYTTKVKTITVDNEEDVGSITRSHLTVTINQIDFKTLYANELAATLTQEQRNSYDFLTQMAELKATQVANKQISLGISQAQTEAQKKILNAVSTTPSPGGGWCAKWVSQVYQKSGFGYLGGNACDMFRRDTKAENKVLEVGMIVAVEKSPSSSKYGHVGIYIGNGIVAESISAGNNKKEGKIRYINVTEWETNNTMKGERKISSMQFGFPDSIQKAIEKELNP